ncbi:EscF/YscF/HrpA family type III secretion system needle major subunit [Noviherbaspirillum sp. CPCC 100848]|uniref:EscF/YscF/HrpA family type III secretion system needle major subunit n=1 Tax=Noviherbaspirillum album TaxID=3080276 RepID=A0ABU6JAP2_9BURK|nr:EscF/YscF/HrpA family type III secretion system needle major subunit [Noviherbaspirillum sp. CPCC 100848]MEC4720713.1 EscF/YscF/HrpA family type III secretion system needle major subunit [Noviherbaspirillum sp. CPCC 100848]
MPENISFQSIGTSLYNAVQTKEASLNTLMQTVGREPTTTDLLKMQSAMNEWSMSIQLNSAMVKEYSDALKGIVQKIG